MIWNKNCSILCTTLGELVTARLQFNCAVVFPISNAPHHSIHSAPLAGSWHRTLIHLSAFCLIIVLSSVQNVCAIFFSRES